MTTASPSVTGKPAPVDDLGVARAKPRERTRAPALPEHQMPEVHLGDSVLWCTEESGVPDKLAVVTRVYNESVDLWVLETGCHNGLPVDGVRHISHPDRTLIKNTGSGVWDYGPREMERQDLVRRVEALEEALRDLIGPVTAPPAGGITNHDPRGTPLS